MFEQKYVSMVPGPTQINPKILQALSQQIVTHLHPDWSPYYREVCKKMGKVCLTSGEVFLMASSGTGGIEAALSSTLEPGERILVLTNGHFGDRIAMIAQRYHLETEILHFPVNESVRPEALKERLGKGVGDLVAVRCGQSESQNGILNPIKELAAIVTGTRSR